jgi:hypothetical protein
MHNANLQKKNQNLFFYATTKCIVSSYLKSIAFHNFHNILLRNAVGINIKVPTIKITKVLRILLIALTLIPFISSAQEIFPFLAKNSAEFLNPKQDTTIEDVYINSNFKVIVQTTDGKAKYKEYQLWGFGNKEGRRFRLYNEKDYEIRQAGDLFIYRRDVSNWIYTNTVYYFSKGADGDIYGLNWANLKDVFSASDPKFLQLIKRETLSPEEYHQYDKKNKSFKIVELYRQSLQ